MPNIWGSRKRYLEGNSVSWRYSGLAPLNMGPKGGFLGGIERRGSIHGFMGTKLRRTMPLGPCL